MEQSPTTSIEQDASPITISRDPSEKSLNTIQKLVKWRRITKRIVQFFRYITIPILRSRFIDTINHMPIDGLEIEEFKNYNTKKVQEDLAFLDDIRRYLEVFNTFVSFGFVWQDKEFRLAKLKANYIYDHYMSTPEAIAKTNIPVETIPSIANRVNSPRVFPSLTYLNLFNDAEKFISEKILMIYMRVGLNVVSASMEKPNLSRYKGNRMPDQSIAQSKEINHAENLNTKPTIDPQYDEIIIPNWTYSTGSGVVYNPIREKCLKVKKRTVSKKAKPVASSDNPMINLKNDGSTSNEQQQFGSITVKSVTSKRPARIHAYHRTNAVRFRTTDLLPSPYSRCDRVFHKNMFDKRRISQQIFICKIHSSSWPQSDRPIIGSKMPYRMASQTHVSHFFPGTIRLCP